MARRSTTDEPRPATVAGSKGARGNEEPDKKLITLLTLHRYFLTASLNRTIFLTTSPTWEGTIQPNKLIALHLWYASLFVLIEGWRSERMRDQAVAKLLRDQRKLRLLEKARNALYHYDREYLNPNLMAVINEPSFHAWANQAQDAMMLALQDEMMAATGRLGA